MILAVYVDGVICSYSRLDGDVGYDAIRPRQVTWTLVRVKDTQVKQALAECRTSEQ